MQKNAEIITELRNRVQLDTIEKEHYERTLAHFNHQKSKQRPQHQQHPHQQQHPIPPSQFQPKQLFATRQDFPPSNQTFQQEMESKSIEDNLSSFDGTELFTFRMSVDSKPNCHQINHFMIGIFRAKRV